MLLSIHIQIALTFSHMAHYYLEHVAVRHNNCREETESLTGTWRKIFLADFIKSVLQLHSSGWDHNVLMSAPTDDFPSHFPPHSTWPTLHHFTLTSCIKHLKSFKLWRSGNAPDTDPQLLLSITYMLEASQWPFTGINYHSVSGNSFSPRSTVAFKGVPAVLKYELQMRVWTKTLRNFSGLLLPSKRT